MKKGLTWGLFCIVVAVAIPYTVFTWQFWVAYLSIIITGEIYARNSQN